MVFTCDDAHRLNPHREKLFSLLAFFLANYKVGATLGWEGHYSVHECAVPPPGPAERRYGTSC
jgi:hypothetical protein